MRALRLRRPAGLENLRLETAESPAPGPGEIRVRIRANSLNYRDYMIALGYSPIADGRILLSDGAGEVVETGPGVTEFRVGDLVMSTFHVSWFDDPVGPSIPTPTYGYGSDLDGFAAEYVTRSALAFTRAPRGFSAAESASLTCAGVTAWRALMVEGGIKPGDRVLVQGTGGVSIFALQFARAAGATVVATSSSPEKLERLKALGADHVINYRDDPQWGETVQRLTGGVDHIVEIGGPSTLEQSLIAAATGAHVAIIGAVQGMAADGLPFASVMMKRLRLQGVMVGSRRDQMAMVRAIEANGIRPKIDRTYPLDDFAAAFDHFSTGQHMGKICLEL